VKTCGRSSHILQQTTKHNRGNTKCSVKYDMEYIIADLNLKNVHLISGDNDNLGGCFEKNYSSHIPHSK
jgi:hypothetical protein